MTYALAQKPADNTRLKRARFLALYSAPLLLASCITQDARDIADYQQKTINSIYEAQELQCREAPPQQRKDPRFKKACNQYIDTRIESACLHRAQQMDGGPIRGSDYIPIVGAISRYNRTVDAMAGRPLNSLSPKARAAYDDCIREEKKNSPYL